MTNSTMHVAGLRCNIGSLPLQWSLSPGETYNTNVRIDVNGVTVFNNTVPNSYTAMTPYEFAGYWNGQKVFWMNKEEFNIYKGVIESELIIGNMKIVKVYDLPDGTLLPKNHRGILFVSNM